jgi:3-hydroxyisobutyrate dehydrogenase-like beta-hydroxyacid dehydrogenase
MAETNKVALIGFGEAGMAFAGAWRSPVRAFDMKTDAPTLAAAKRADYRQCGVTGADSLAEALAGADLVLSIVTADQALTAARAASAAIEKGALYCDFNSVAPATKQAAARAIEGAGARYVDVAVMAPVHPARLSVPLLVSGADSEAAIAALAAIGFAPKRIEGPVGRASTIKMLRSVMVKGIEALTAECFLAARAAGVAEAVTESLSLSWPGMDWAARADYNLERMETHGLRRAAEMEEVAATLAGLGQGSDMARATAAVQRRIGAAAAKAQAEAA